MSEPVQNISPVEIASATGGFHSVAEIGEGGFGKVYRAMVKHRPVACKVMATDGLQGQTEFDNEVSVLSRVSHGHLVRLLGVCRSREPQLRCLLYELMPAGNVEDQMVTQSGQCVLTWWLRLRVAAQVSAAISYLHTLPSSAGGPLIHRDIKPANMFLDGRLNAKLGDVGLATPASAGGSHHTTRSGEQDMVGTYPYLAPEYRSSGTISLKTDVYALGVSLLQLATGQQERLQDIVQRCSEAVGAGQASSVLDPVAGGWDEAAGERLLCLGLWCCTPSADARPSSSVVAQELAKLHQAADQARRAAAAWSSAASSSKQMSSKGAEAVSSNVISDKVQQHTGLAALEGASNSSGPSAAAGNFWRFLTSSTG